MMVCPFSGPEKDTLTLPSALAFSFGKHWLSMLTAQHHLDTKLVYFFKSSAGVEHYNMTSCQDRHFQLEVPFAKEPEVLLLHLRAAPSTTPVLPASLKSVTAEAAS